MCYFAIIISYNLLCYLAIMLLLNLLYRLQWAILLFCSLYAVLCVLFCITIYSLRANIGYKPSGTIILQRHSLASFPDFIVLAWVEIMPANKAKESPLPRSQTCHQARSVTTACCHRTFWGHLFLALGLKSTQT